jgi:hypothetical protein
MEALLPEKNPVYPWTVQPVLSAKKYSGAHPQITASEREEGKQGFGTRFASHGTAHKLIRRLQSGGCTHRRCSLAHVKGVSFEPFGKAQDVRTGLES